MAKMYLEHHPGRLARLKLDYYLQAAKRNDHIFMLVVASIVWLPGLYLAFSSEPGTGVPSGWVTYDGVVVGTPDLSPTLPIGQIFGFICSFVLSFIAVHYAKSRDEWMVEAFRNWVQSLRQFQPHLLELVVSTHPNQPHARQFVARHTK
jgi:hypothetical protein